MRFHVFRAWKDGCARGRWGCTGERWECATDVVCFLGPWLDHHQVLTQTVCVCFAFHHTRRHIREGTPSTLLAPHVLGLRPFLPHTPTHRTHCMGGTGTIKLKHARWASAFSVSQGSTRQFLNHWPWAWLTTVMAFLYAILMPGKGPYRTTAADTQACVGTVLRHISSCWTLVTG